MFKKKKNKSSQLLRIFYTVMPPSFQYQKQQHDHDWRALPCTSIITLQKCYAVKYCNKHARWQAWYHVCCCREEYMASGCYMCVLLFSSGVMSFTVSAFTWIFCAVQFSSARNQWRTDDIKNRDISSFCTCIVNQNLLLKTLSDCLSKSSQWSSNYDYVDFSQKSKQKNCCFQGHFCTAAVDKNFPLSCGRYHWHGAVIFHLTILVLI